MALRKYQIRGLRKLRELANFERAHFERIGVGVDEKLPVLESEVTAFIKERTRLYRQTWVLPLIDALLRGDVEAVNRKCD